MGSLTNDDGNGNENVILKYNFSFLWFFCDDSNLFNLENAGDLSWDKLLWKASK